MLCVGDSVEDNGGDDRDETNCGKRKNKDYAHTVTVGNDRSQHRLIISTISAVMLFWYCM